MTRLAVNTTMVAAVATGLTTDVRVVVVVVMVLMAVVVSLATHFVHYTARMCCCNLLNYY